MKEHEVEVKESDYKQGRKARQGERHRRRRRRREGGGGGGEPSQLVNRSDLSGRPQGGAIRGAARNLGTLIPM